MSEYVSGESKSCVTKENCRTKNILRPYLTNNSSKKILILKKEIPQLDSQKKYCLKNNLNTFSEDKTKGGMKRSKIISSDEENEQPPIKKQQIESVKTGKVKLKKLSNNEIDNILQQSFSDNESSISDKKDIHLGSESNFKEQLHSDSDGSGSSNTPIKVEALGNVENSELPLSKTKSGGISDDACSETKDKHETIKATGTIDVSYNKVDKEVASANNFNTSDLDSDEPLSLVKSSSKIGKKKKINSDIGELKSKKKLVKAGSSESDDEDKTNKSIIDSKKGKIRKKSSSSECSEKDDNKSDSSDSDKPLSSVASNSRFSGKIKFNSGSIKPNCQSKMVKKNKLGYSDTNSETEDENKSKISIGAQKSKTGKGVLTKEKDNVADSSDSNENLSRVKSGSKLSEKKKIGLNSDLVKQKSKKKFVKYDRSGSSDSCSEIEDEGKPKKSIRPRPRSVISKKGKIKKGSSSNEDSEKDNQSDSSDSEKPLSSVTSIFRVTEKNKINSDSVNPKCKEKHSIKNELGCFDTNNETEDEDNSKRSINAPKSKIDKGILSNKKDNKSDSSDSDENLSGSKICENNKFNSGLGLLKSNSKDKFGQVGLDSNFKTDDIVAKDKIDDESSSNKSRERDNESDSSVSDKSLATFTSSSKVGIKNRSVLLKPKSKSKIIKKGKFRSSDTNSYSEDVDKSKNPKDRIEKGSISNENSEKYNKSDSSNSDEPLSTVTSSLKVGKKTRRTSVLVQTKSKKKFKKDKFISSDTNSDSENEDKTKNPKCKLEKVRTNENIEKDTGNKSDSSDSDKPLSTVMSSSKVVEKIRSVLVKPKSKKQIDKKDKPESSDTNSDSEDEDKIQNLKSKIETGGTSSKNSEKDNKSDSSDSDEQSSVTSSLEVGKKTRRTSVLVKAKSKNKHVKKDKFISSDTNNDSEDEDKTKNPKAKLEKVSANENWKKDDKSVSSDSDEPLSTVTSRSKVVNKTDRTSVLVKPKSKNQTVKKDKLANSDHKSDSEAEENSEKDYKSDSSDSDVPLSTVTSSLKVGKKTRRKSVLVKSKSQSKFVSNNKLGCSESDTDIETEDEDKSIKSIDAPKGIINIGSLTKEDCEKNNKSNFSNSMEPLSLVKSSSKVGERKKINSDLVKQKSKIKLVKYDKAGSSESEGENNSKKSIIFSKKDKIRKNSSFSEDSEKVDSKSDSSDSDKPLSSVASSRIVEKCKMDRTGSNSETEDEDKTTHVPISKNIEKEHNSDSSDSDKPLSSVKSTSKFVEKKSRKSSLVKSKPKIKLVKKDKFESSASNSEAEDENKNKKSIDVPRRKLNKGSLTSEDSEKDDKSDFSDTDKPVTSVKAHLKKSSDENSSSSVDNEIVAKNNKSKNINKNKESFRKTKKSTEKDPLHYYKRCLKAMGVHVRSYDKLFGEVKSIARKKDKLLNLMQENGLKGKPTLQNCQKIKKKNETKKEVQELDLGNIISDSRRGRRNVESLYATVTNLNEPQFSSPIKKSRIRKVSSSDSE